MRNMQKLERRKYTHAPTDAPQVRSNCEPSLNREETLSVASLKTLSNNSKVDLLPKEEGQNLRVSVYVLNMRGTPLMPTTPRKARTVLRQGKARVVRRTPFTIQLLYATGETKQPVTLGTDTGYSSIGLSAVSEKKELISADVRLRDDIVKLLSKRRGHRRNRRSKLWHREPRFDNRKKDEGWFAPSIQHKLDTHNRLVNIIKRILPITETIIEVATFDTQKMQNPEIKGVEYQQGELQGYHVREYLLEKWGRKCAYCKKIGIPLEIDHITPKSRGGTDRVSNLTVSCHKCNQKKGDRTAEEFGHPEIQKKAKKSLRTTAFMNIVRWRIVNLLGCKHTYGYITKHNRIKHGLEKTHINDAFVIAGGCKQERCKPFVVTQTQRNNRSIQMNRKGFKPSIRKKRHKLQPNDLVRFKGKECRVKGAFNYGKWVRLTNKIGDTLNAKVRDVELICYGKGLQFT